MPKKFLVSCKESCQVWLVGFLFVFSPLISIIPYNQLTIWEPSKFLLNCKGSAQKDKKEINWQLANMMDLISWNIRAVINVMIGLVTTSLVQVPKNSVAFVCEQKKAHVRTGD
jgi:hypothetical protein